MRGCLIVVGYLALWAGITQAAELQDTDRANCNAELTGQITRGYARRVSAWIESEYAAQPPAEHPEPVTLCLDSPGGNFAEALKIARLLYDHSIGTRLGAQASCLSSCALIFMMGTDQYLGHAQGEVIGPRRAMHPTAQLGFHRPELRLPPSDTRRNDADVERSFNLAIEATLVLVELANLPTFDGVMIPADLLQAMFTHRGKDFYFIDTTGKAGRWEITADVLDWPETMDRLGLFNACNNLVAWEHGYEPSYDSTEVSGLDQAVEMVRGGDAPLFAVNGVFWNYDDMHSCVIEMPRDMVSLRICGSAPARAVKLGQSECLFLADADRNVSTTWGNMAFHADPLVFLSPDVPMSAAPEVLAAQALQGTSEWAKDVDGTGGLRRRCYALEMTAEVYGVQNFATLRDRPGFNQALVAEIAPGTRVDRVNSIPAAERANIPDGPDDCAHLCRNTEGAYSGVASAGPSYDMEAINACFEANRIWYAVRTPDGKAGWISGKFLRY